MGIGTYLGLVIEIS